MMEKVTEIEQRLDDARKKQTELKTQLDKSAETIAKSKADYEEKVRSGAGESELDALDEALYKAERERARIEIRLTQSGRDIEELFGAREVAHREEEDKKNRADETAAMEEAAVLEKAILAFVAAADAHWKRVQRISDYYKSRGIGQNPFKLSNLERRVSAVFRNGSVIRVFEQSYEKIFSGNIEAAKKQLNQLTPVGEAINAEAEQQSAVND